MGITSKDLVIDKVFKFGKIIEELRSKEYYSDAPKEIVNLFGKLVEQTVGLIENTDEEDIVRIRRINALLSFYHLCLDEIEHIGLDNVPIEMLPIFKGILTKCGMPTIMVLRPSPYYNYSHYSITEAIKKANTFLGFNFKEFHDIMIISFPSSEKNSALLHCAIAYEIGHHLNTFFKVASEIEPKILGTIDEKLLDIYVNKFLESLSRTKRVIGQTEVTLNKFLLRDQLTSLRKEEFARVIRNWIDEIVSDILAIHFFGPSFVFALTEFSLSGQETRAYSESHPPLFIRLRNLLNIYDNLHFSDDLQSYEKITKRIEYYRTISNESFQTRIDTGAELKNAILEKAVVALFEEARKLVETKLAFTKPYNPYLMEKAIESLRNLIPGNEILNDNYTSQPIDAVSILNAAWIVRIALADDLYKTLERMPKAKIRDLLDELVLKSLELQEFHRQMVTLK